MRFSIWSIKETNIDAQITSEGVLSVGDNAILGSHITVVATSVTDSKIYSESSFLVCGVESMPVRVNISGKENIATMTDKAYTKEQYTALVYDQYDALIDSGVEWSWSVDTSKSTVKNISVDSNGVVSVGKNSKAGKLVITASATYGGVTAVSDFEINVTQSVEGISFEQGGVSIESGGERSIAVKIYPENAENKKFTVNSSDTDAFEVSADGSNVIVKSKSDGQAVITVTSDDGGFEAQMTASTAKSIATDVDTSFENGGTGWTVNKVNIIPNGDFEERSAWSSVGASTGRADSGYITKDESSELVYEGTASAYLKYGAAAATNLWSAFRNSESFMINPESTYKLGMAVNIPDMESGQRAALSFKITDNNNSQIVGEDSDIMRVTTATSGWENKETEYTIPKNGTKISLFAARGYAKDGFTAYFDNLKFETIAEVTSDVYYGGAHAMRVGAYNGVHSDACEMIVSDGIKIEGGKAYSVSSMAKGDAETVTEAIGIEYLNASKDVIKTAQTEPKTSSDWTSVSVSGTAPSEAEYIKIKLISGGTGISYFDNISVIEEAVYPNGISITGPDTIAIPKSGTKSKSYKINILDQYGEPMNDYSAVSELKNGAVGVQLQGNVLNVSSNANTGEVTIVSNFESLSEEKTVSLIKVTSFEFKDLPDSVDRGNANITYDLKTVLGVLNVKTELSGDEVEYSLSDNYEGVSVSKDGKLVISPSAKLGMIKIKAVLTDNDDVVAEHSLTIKKSANQSSSTGGGASGGSGSGGSTGGSGIKYIEGSLEMPGYVDAPTGGVKTQQGTAIWDVPQSHWAYLAVSTFAQNGIVSGRGDGTFDPNGIVTRSEFLKILISVFKLELSYELVNFTDTVETQWYYPYISSAFANGITSGYPDGTFGINRPVTREEMAVFTKRALDVRGRSFENKQADASTFTDMGKVSDFAREAVEMMRQSGFLSGNDKGMFNPKNNATRAETVMMLYRVYSKLY